MKHLLSVFKDAEKISWPLVILFVLINAIVLYNASFHNPKVQYDSTGHVANVTILSMGRMYMRGESGEFFSPPLPYVLPALIVFAGQTTVLQAMKIAQLLNVLLSLGLTFLLLKIAELCWPGRVSARLISLGMLGLLPVYYRTFAYVRGEPFVAFLTVFAIYQAIRIFNQGQGQWWAVGLLGVTLGLDILARQWAFFFFPALFIFVGFCVWSGQTTPRQALLRLGAIAVLAALVGGWFYAWLGLRYGTLTAFNRQSDEQLLGSQPISFYTGLGLGNLFSKPVRPLLDNRLIPILYSDTWGDYWGYFLIYVIDSRTGNQVAGNSFENAISKPSQLPIVSNYQSFGAYLGRVNLVSILPSLIFLAGFLYAIWKLIASIKPPGRERFVEASHLLTLSALSMLSGYFWFLVTYPILKTGGDTVKASYLLAVYPLCALLVANLFEKQEFLRRRQHWLWGLALVFIHNFSALLTHFFVLPWN